MRASPSAGDTSQSCPCPDVARHASAAIAANAAQPPPTYHAIQDPCRVGTACGCGPSGPSGSPVTWTTPDSAWLVTSWSGMGDAARGPNWPWVEMAT